MSLSYHKQVTPNAAPRRRPIQTILGPSGAPLMKSADSAPEGSHSPSKGLWSISVNLAKKRRKCFRPRCGLPLENPLGSKQSYFELFVAKAGCLAGPQIWNRSSGTLRAHIEMTALMKYSMSSRAQPAMACRQISLPNDFIPRALWQMIPPPRTTLKLLLLPPAPGFHQPQRQTKPQQAPVNSALFGLRRGGARLVV